MSKITKLLLLGVFIFFLSGCDLFNAGEDPTTTIEQTVQTTEETAETTEEESDLTVKLKQIYGLAVEADEFDGTYEEWLETVRGPKGDDGREIVLQVSEGYVQWKYEGEDAWANLFDLSTVTGSDGIGISGTSINEQGELVISYSDGTEENLGIPVVLHSVTFKDHNGYVIDTQQVPYGTAVTPPEDPSREGHTFSGWSAAFDNITEDVTIEAEYTVNTYDVTFYLEDGTEFSVSEDIEYGSTVELPTPDKDGYVLEGWFLSQSTHAEPFYETSLVKSDLALYARWVSEPAHTIAFMDHDGNIVYQTLKTHEEAIDDLIVPEPSRDGYMFLGWDETLPDVMPDHDLVYHAQYNKLPELSGIKDIQIAEGDSFDPLADVAAVDKEDGDITTSITVEGKVETEEPGEYVLKYIIIDDEGGKTVKERIVEVVPKNQMDESIVNQDMNDLDFAITTYDVLSQFELPTEGQMGSTITWDVISGHGIIYYDDYNDVTKASVDYYDTAGTLELLATISYGNTSETKSFTFNINAANTTDIATALGGTQGTAYTVTGTVYYLTEDGYFIDDGTDRIFVYDYGNAQTAINITAGDKVAVHGELGSYKGEFQLTNNPVTSSAISTGNTVDTTSEGTDYSNPGSGDFYTLQGTVFYGIDASYNDTYENLYIQDSSGTTVAMIHYSSLQSCLDTLTGFDGYEVSFDAVYYHTDGIPVFVFMGVANDVSLPNYTDADIVGIAKTALTLPQTNVDVLSEIELPTEGEMNTTIDWGVTSGYAVIYDDDYYGVTKARVGYYDTAGTLTLTATITYGSASDTKQFDLNVDPISVTDIDTALAGSQGDMYLIKGTVYYITESGYFVDDGTNWVFVYDYGSALQISNISVGDEVAVYGELGSYKNELQLTGNPVTSSVLSSGNSVNRVTQGTDFSNPVAGEVYTLQGEVFYGIDPAYNGTHENLYIRDASGNTIAMIHHSSFQGSLDVLEMFNGYEVSFDAVYYHTDNIPVFVFMGTMNDVTQLTFTDAQVVQQDKAALDFPSLNIDEMTEIELPTEGPGGSTISWDVINGSGHLYYDDYDDVYKVRVDYYGVQDELGLLATISYQSAQDTKEFIFDVNTLPESDISVVTSGTLGTMYLSKGIVYCLTQNGYFLDDGTDRIFVYDYGTAQELSNISVGDEVAVYGELVEYNGSPQLANEPVTSYVISPNNPLSMTSEGTDYSNPGAGDIYTLQGTVFYGIDANYSSTYENLYIQDSSGNTVAMVHHNSLQSMIDILRAFDGYEVTFDAVYYHTDGIPKFIFMGSANDVTLPNMTDADVVGIAKTALSIAQTNVNELSEIELPTEGELTSAIDWAVSSGSASIYYDNYDDVTKAQVDYYGTSGTLSLSATIAYGNASDTKVFSFTVDAFNETDIASALTGNQGDMYLIKGTVYCLTEDGYFLDDATDRIFVYDRGLAMDLHNITVGDEVAVYGELASFNGELQLTGDPVTSSVISSGNLVNLVSEGTDISNPQAGDVYTLEGTVFFGIDDTIHGTYENIYIQDDTGTSIAMIHHNTLQNPKDVLLGFDHVEVTFDAVYYHTANGIPVFVFMGTANDVALVN